jgi:hypothetical protein
MFSAVCVETVVDKLGPAGWHWMAEGITVKIPCLPPVPCGSAPDHDMVMPSTPEATRVGRLTLLACLP